MQDLSSPYQGLNWLPLQWKHGILTTGPPESPELVFYALDLSPHLLCLQQAPPGTPAHVTSSLCPAMQDPPGEQQPVFWAPKWVDYSSKYRFGYQLSDSGNRVLVRDSTHMALHPPGG